MCIVIESGVVQLTEISGKTFIITGASSGLGRALALALATMNVGLVLNARSSETLEKIAAECAEKGAKTSFLAGSAADERVARELVKKAVDTGAFLGFIQAAGVLHPGPAVWDLSNFDFSEIFEASVTASYQLAKAAFPHLLEAGEGIAVFLGSGAAEKVVPGMGTYCAAKAAEEQLVRHFAAEAPEITSFVFRPGVVDTPMVRSALQAQGRASIGLRKHFAEFEKNGEILNPEIPVNALISILKNNPRRFHGKIATWRDGV